MPDVSPHAILSWRQDMTVSSRAFAAMLKIGPPVTREVTVERAVPVGTDLLTDVYLARARDPLPVILMRTPYGRRGPYGTMARLFAERGYHAVVQSTRGTFGSGGQIDYDREAADGRLDHQSAMVERRDRRVRRQLPDLHPVGAGLDPAAPPSGAVTGPLVAAGAGSRVRRSSSPGAGRTASRSACP